ncbi:hypothetical protein SESBI_05881 [Sesbania bispinosa]|nr:hypothetical protein SESBI_05881 [Sesbania bispinosa]
MVKSRSAYSEQPLEGSSSSNTETEDSSSVLIPRSVSFTTWTRLPPARVVPVDSSAQKWVTDREPPLRPFRHAPNSGDDFFRDSLISRVIHRKEALLFHSVPDTPTHFWLDHIFANDPPFMDILNKVGIADAIKLSPRLGVFRKVDDLEYLVQRWSHVTHTFYTSWGEFSPTLEDVCVCISPTLGSHVLDMAKDLKVATIESAKYYREFLVKRRVAPVPHADSSTKTPPKKVRGTRNILPPRAMQERERVIEVYFCNMGALLLWRL